VSERAIMAFSPDELTRHRLIGSPSPKGHSGAIALDDGPVAPQATISLSEGAPLHSAQHTAPPALPKHSPLRNPASIRICTIAEWMLHIGVLYVRKSAFSPSLDVPYLHSISVHKAAAGWTFRGGR